jgi:hypothetical protein
MKLVLYMYNLTYLKYGFFASTTVEQMLWT